MCFKSPKMPTVVADADLANDKEIASLDLQATRAASKENRLAESLARANGTFGRSSLFSGGAGGMGYATPAARSLFQVNV